MIELTVRRTVSADLFPFSSSRFYPFSRGRIALIAAMKMIDPLARGILLLPAYICRSVTDTLEHFGYHYVYYPVTRSGEPRLEEIERLSIGGISALLAVNYFGYPQRLDPLLGYCGDQGIVLIEDNAHGFLGSDPSGIPLGGRGDIGIFSFPKTLYVPDGGGMIVNSPHLSDRLESADFPMPVPRFHGTFRLKRRVLKGFESIGIDSRFVGRLRGRGGSGKEKVEDWDRGMSTVTQHLLGHIDPRVAAENRRNNYREVVRICAEEGLEPLTPDPGESVCPYLVPIVAERAKPREKGAALIRGRGWKVSHWPDLPSNVDRRSYPNAWWLRENIMAIYLRPAVI